jgi:hypothetical protein
MVRGKKPHRSGDEVLLVDPTRVAKSYSEGQGVGISVSKTCGGLAPWLDVGVVVASGDGEDHPTT